MKKILLFGLIFLTSCHPFRHKTPEPPPRDGYFAQKKDGNTTLTIEDHPEYPIVLSPETPAWKVGLWLAIIIILVCVTPAVGRYIHRNWRPFWETTATKLKNLTKKKK